MKALVYTGPNALEWRDEPEPTLGDHEVLVRVEGVGICGSDMHAYHGPPRRPPPSCSATRPRAGSSAARNDGRRVAVNPPWPAAPAISAKADARTCARRARSSRRARARSPSSCAPPSATPSFCPTASTPPRLRSLSPSPSRTTRCSRERACLDARSPRAAVPSSAAARSASAAPSCSPGKGRRTSQSASQTKDGGERPRGRDLSGATSRKVATARRTGR